MPDKQDIAVAVWPQGLRSFSIDLDPGVRCGVVSDARMMAEEAVTPVQTHSCNVALISSGHGGLPCLDDTDSLVCMRRGVRIGVRTADCVPVVIYAPDIAAVAAVHAGWRGTLGGIVDRTLDRLAALGADPGVMKVAFGPSVCGRCYEVDAELAARFARAGFEDAVAGSRHVDLEEVNRMRLVSAGVRSCNVRGKDFCLSLIHISEPTRP